MQRIARRWWLPAGLLALAVSVSLLAFMAPSARAGNGENVVEISMTARQWAFDPGTITVNQGDRVRLKVTSTDVSHGFFLDGYDNINVTLTPGLSKTIEFVADRPGRWMFRCSETCGNFHPYMIGWLRVRPNWYAGASWLGIGAIGMGFVGFLLWDRVRV